MFAQPAIELAHRGLRQLLHDGTRSDLQMSQRPARRSHGLLAQFARKDQGVTAIEFGFVGAPFLYLLLVIFEMGMMLFTEYTMENGTAEAARLIRTGQVQTEGTSAADFKQAVCEQVVFLDCESKLYVDVRKYTDFASVSAPSSISSDGDGNKEISDDISVGAQFDPGGPGDVVVVRVYYDWQLFMPHIPGMAGFSNLENNRRLLSATFAFMNEPYSE
jgi:Flp pilus assembly protein TadG